MLKCTLHIETELYYFTQQDHVVIKRGCSGISELLFCVVTWSSKCQSLKEVMDWFLSRSKSPELPWVP